MRCSATLGSRRVGFVAASGVARGYPSARFPDGPREPEPLHLWAGANIRSTPHSGARSRSSSSPGPSGRRAGHLPPSAGSLRTRYVETEPTHLLNEGCLARGLQEQVNPRLVTTHVSLRPRCGCSRSIASATVDRRALRSAPVRAPLRSTVAPRRPSVTTSLFASEAMLKQQCSGPDRSGTPGPPDVPPPVPRCLRQKICHAEHRSPQRGRRSSL